MNKVWLFLLEFCFKIFSFLFRNFDLSSIVGHTSLKFPVSRFVSSCEYVRFSFFKERVFAF